MPTTCKVIDNKIEQENVSLFCSQAKALLSWKCESHLLYHLKTAFQETKPTQKQQHWDLELATYLRVSFNCIKGDDLGTCPFLHFLFTWPSKFPTLGYGNMRDFVLFWWQFLKKNSQWIQGPYCQYLHQFSRAGKIKCHRLSDLNNRIILLTVVEIRS